MKADAYLDRVAVAKRLLAQGLSGAALKSALRKELGAGLHARAIARLVLRARQSFARDVTRGEGDELRGQLVATLQGIIADPRSRPLEKVRAVAGVAELLGLNAATKQEVSLAVQAERKPITIDWEQMRQARRELFGVRPANLTNGGGRQ